MGGTRSMDIVDILNCVILTLQPKNVLEFKIQCTPVINTK